MPVKTLRKVVEIDEDKCNGCGLCIPACKEGAIRIVDGKARLAEDRYCDGLGACLGECPRGAISIVEREAEEFDQGAALEHVRAADAADHTSTPCGCPSAAVMSLSPSARPPAADVPAPGHPWLSNWPVQLALVPVGAPWLDGVNLLISADCVPFAYADFQDGLLRGRQVITACPKLDDVGPYLDKLTAIFREHDIRSVTVARMEVPCCQGLVMLVRRALAAAGGDTPFGEVVVGIQGNTLSRS